MSWLNYRVNTILQNVPSWFKYFWRILKIGSTGKENLYLLEETCAKNWSWATWRWRRRICTLAVCPRIGTNANGPVWTWKSGNRWPNDSITTWNLSMPMTTASGKRKPSNGMDFWDSWLTTLSMPRCRFWISAPIAFKLSIIRRRLPRFSRALSAPGRNVWSLRSCCFRCVIKSSNFWEGGSSCRLYWLHVPCWVGSFEKKFCSSSGNSSMWP